MGTHSIYGRKRVVLPIQISSQSSEKFAEYSNATGMTYIAICTKLVEWFASQDYELQSSILGINPEITKKDPVIMILEKMAL